MSGTRWGALRPVPRTLGIALTAAAAVFAGVTGLGTGHAGLQIVAVVLVGATLLRLLEKRPIASPLADWKPGEPIVPEVAVARPRGYRRRLGEGVRLSLQVLGQVGHDLPGLDRRRLEGAAQAVQQESARLVGVMDEMLGGARSHEEIVDLEPLLEELLEVHRPLLAALDVQVRVVMGHRSARIHGRRTILLESFGALLRHTLGRLREGATLHLRTRQVAGLFSIQVYGEAVDGDAGLPAPQVEQARQVVIGQGGEVWDDEDAGCGFGLTLPLLSSRGSRPVAVAPVAAPR